MPSSLIHDPCNNQLWGILVRPVTEELAMGEQLSLHKKLLTLVYEA